MNHGEAVHEASVKNEIPGTSTHGWHEGGTAEKKSGKDNYE